MDDCLNQAVLFQVMLTLAAVSWAQLSLNIQDGSLTLLVLGWELIWSCQLEHLRPPSCGLFTWLGLS